MNSGGDHSGDLAVRAVVQAAISLPIDLCREVHAGLGDWLLMQQQNHYFDLHPLAARDRRYTGALIAVAQVLGHPPSTTEYGAEMKRRRELGDGSLPSASSILKHFRTWTDVLVAAGLVKPPEPTGTARRRRRPYLIVPAYDDGRLIQCLQACARKLGRPPTTRDYVVWREEVMGARRASESDVRDIPHLNTFYDHFGSWEDALRRAGLDTRRCARRNPEHRLVEA